MEDTQGGGAKKTTIEDFTMLRLLGKGSYGDVFLMEKKDGGGIFALKTMNKMHMAREKKQHHVFVEKEVLSSFESPWLVKLHNCFQDKQQLYFLMEHVRNGELAQYFQSRTKLSLTESRFLGAEIVLILEFLRQCGIVHRDLKPENLLLDGTNHLKVIDFGTGKFIQLANNVDFIKKINAIKAKFAEAPKPDEEGQQERRNSFVGTPFYLSPELIKEEEVSFPADIWAFGILMYRMVTGKFPYPDMSDYELFESIKNDKITFPDDIDADARDLISKLLQKDPAQRIGAGTEESGNGFSALKKHPFFKGIDWVNIRSLPSPINKEPEPLKTVDKETDYTNLANNGATRDKKVLKTGLIRKYKKLMFYDTRQFILYDNGTLEYKDPETSDSKGVINLTADCSAVKKDDKGFDLVTPGRTYDLKSVEFSADEWCDCLNKEIARIKKEKAGSSDKLGLSNI